MVKAEKDLVSGNHVTIKIVVEHGEATMTTAYAEPPTDADKAEVDAVRREAAKLMGVEEIIEN